MHPAARPLFALPPLHAPQNCTRDAVTETAVKQERAKKLIHEARGRPTKGVWHTENVSELHGAPWIAFAIALSRAKGPGLMTPAMRGRATG